MEKFRLLKPFNIWFTGLPCSGKTTTAIALKKSFVKSDIKIILLDGDEIRKGLSADLGFKAEDREENNRRIIYITELIVNQGIPVLTTFISPYRKTRRIARSIIPNFIEVFIDTPLETCIKRDVKGLYAKAKKGEIIGMTGIDDKYEIPEKPEISLETVNKKVTTNIQNLIFYLKEKRFITNVI